MLRLIKNYLVNGCSVTYSDPIMPIVRDKAAKSKWALQAESIHLQHARTISSHWGERKHQHVQICVITRRDGYGRIATLVLEKSNDQVRFDQVKEWCERVTKTGTTRVSQKYSGITARFCMSILNTSSYFFVSLLDNGYAPVLWNQEFLLESKCNSASRTWNFAKWSSTIHVSTTLMPV